MFFNCQGKVCGRQTMHTQAIGSGLCSEVRSQASQGQGLSSGRATRSSDARDRPWALKNCRHSRGLRKQQ